MRNIGNKMSGIPIILVTLIIGLIIIGILIAIVLWKRKYEGITKEPDYRAFLIMGISFLPMGIIFTAAISPGFIGFAGLGVVYIAIGLANRDKWKEQ